MTRVLKGPARLVILLLIALLPSCSSEDSHEKILQDSLTLMEKASTILEAVEDQKSATAAGGKLEDLAAKFEKISERNEAIGTPDAETQETLHKKYMDRQKEVSTRLTKATKAALAKGVGMENFIEKIEEAVTYKH